ncbi:MAG: DUF2029 domain-containing protein [Planctomycetes bacterium]|nr:DUF2029 domain-containing protein [Planctomycetota bacterium]
MDGPAAVQSRSAASQRLPPPPVARRGVRLACAAVLLLLGGYLGYLGFRAIHNQGQDFEYFYRAGEWLLVHGGLDQGYDRAELETGGYGPLEPRGMLDWYLPFVHRLLTLLACLPFEPAGVIWLLLNLVALFTTMRLIGQHMMGLPRQDWPVTQLLPFVFLLVFWWWEFRLNQINNFTLLLLVASFVQWQRGRRFVPGLWLGLAVLTKVTPFLLVLWFALKRQYRTVSAAVLTIILAGPVSDVIVFGPEQAGEYYRGWVRNAVVQGSHRGLVLAQREVDWRNQGLGSVLSRWLHPTNYNTRFDNDPRANSTYSFEARTLNVAHLSRSTVGWIATAILGISFVGLLLLARRPARELSLWQLRMEWALFVLAMLWFMPVMRRYHMIWALPALSLLAAGIHYLGMRAWWSKLALLSMGAIVLSQLALLPTVVTREYYLEGLGMLLVAVVVVATPLIVALLRPTQPPAALLPEADAPPHPARPSAAGRTRPGQRSPSVSSHV